ncbi:MAG TPA: DUF1801 domain-containing protein [Polyangiaceae bacterium]
MAVRKNAPARKNAPVKKSLPRKATPKANAKTKAAPKTKATAKPKAKPKPGPKAKPVAKAKAKTKAAPKAKPVAKPELAAKAKPTPRAESAPKAKPAPSTVSPAREARKAAAMMKTIEQVIAPIESDKAVVDAYMRDLDHPFKAEIEAVRAIILGASTKVSERIKWNAPSFFYKEDLAAFHPRATEFAHLILLFPGGAGVPAKGSLLEGKAKDRREAKFHSLEDVETKKLALEKLVKDWVALRDA